MILLLLPLRNTISTDKNATAIGVVAAVGNISNIEVSDIDFGRIEFTGKVTGHKDELVSVVDVNGAHQQIVYSNETTASDFSLPIQSVSFNATDESDLFNRTFPNGFDEWWNKLDPKGKELMLSQILADDSLQWNGGSNQTTSKEEDIQESIQQKPMTIDEFKEKAIEIVKKTAEELYETEAILKAPPGANSIEELDEEQQASRALSVLAATEFLLMEDKNSNNDNSTDLDILEMDNPLVSSSSDSNIHNSDENAEIITTMNDEDDSSAVSISSGAVDSSSVLKDISSAIQADLPINESSTFHNAGDDGTVREMTDLNV